MEPVLIASDHAAVDLKTKIQKFLPQWRWTDLGPATDARVDYPDYAEKLAQEISAGRSKLGVLICGSGIGMSIAANKFTGVRAAVVESVTSAKLSKEHNNANVLCLGARIVDEKSALEIVRVWLETPFSGDERHTKRIQKITDLERKLK